MELAEQIAALRKKHGFSQEELGEKLGVMAAYWAMTL